LSETKRWVEGKGIVIFAFRLTISGAWETVVVRVKGGGHRETRESPLGGQHYSNSGKAEIELGSIVKG
jgi:hypothetical protein